MPKLIDAVGRVATAMERIAKNMEPRTPSPPIADLLIELADWRGAYDVDDLSARLRAEEQFYQATGVFAPGRDVPMAMSSPQNDDHEGRRRIWVGWAKERNDDLNRRIREALVLVGYDGPEGAPKMCKWCETEEADEDLDGLCEECFENRNERG